MFLHTTTRNERRVIIDVFNEMIPALDRAHYLLCGIAEDYFSAREQKPIAKYQAEHIGIMLQTVNDIIWDVLLTYHLTTGEDEWRGVKPRMVEYQRAKLAQEVNAEVWRLYEAETRLPPAERAEAAAQRVHLCELPDEQALPLLKQLAREGGVRA